MLYNKPLYYINISVAVLCVCDGFISFRISDWILHRADSSFKAWSYFFLGGGGGGGGVGGGWVGGVSIQFYIPFKIISATLKSSYD